MINQLDRLMQLLCIMALNIVYAWTKKKCENEADRRMVSSSDGVLKKDRQWGHCLVRNMINKKQKLGFGQKTCEAVE